MAACEFIHIELQGGPPWGFRLCGGKDSGSPIRVAAVRPNSPAESAQLQEGDRLVKLNGYDAFTLTHHEALNIIQMSGHFVYLVISRKGYSPDVGYSYHTVVAPRMDDPPLEPVQFHFRRDPVQAELPVQWSVLPGSVYHSPGDQEDQLVPVHLNTPPEVRSYAEFDCGRSSSPPAQQFRATTEWKPVRYNQPSTVPVSGSSDWTLSPPITHRINYDAPSTVSVGSLNIGDELNSGYKGVAKENISSVLNRQSLFGVKPQSTGFGDQGVFQVGQSIAFEIGAPLTKPVLDDVPVQELVSRPVPRPIKVSSIKDDPSLLLFQEKPVETDSPKEKKFKWEVGQYSAVDYPSTKEQKQKCKEVANSLFSELNANAKGGKMFKKRVERSSKWGKEGYGKSIEKPNKFLNKWSDITDLERLNDDEGGEPAAEGVAPGSASAAAPLAPPPPPDLALFASGDWKKKRQEQAFTYTNPTSGEQITINPTNFDVNVNKLSRCKHDNVTPKVCQQLVSSLESGMGGTGSRMFQKRKDKSAKWVKDESNVNTISPGVHEFLKKNPGAKVPLGDKKLSGVQRNPSVPPDGAKLEVTPSPWDAALETGSVEGAFKPAQAASKPSQPVFKPPPMGGFMSELANKMGQRRSEKFDAAAGRDGRVGAPESGPVTGPKIPASRGPVPFAKNGPAPFRAGGP